MSVISIIGLVGVSRKTSRVVSRIASSIAASRVVSTQEKCRS